MSVTTDTMEDARYTKQCESEREEIIDGRPETD